MKSVLHKGFFSSKNLPDVDDCDVVVDVNVDVSVAKLAVLC